VLELGDRIYERARLTGEFRPRSGAVTSDTSTGICSSQTRACWARLRRLWSPSVVCVIDREAGGRRNLGAEAPDLRSPFTIGELQRGHATDPARS
jgi:hypothetical protein